MGPKELGETCSNLKNAEYCDGNKTLFCYNHKCVRACDYSRGENNNPDCYSDEVCEFTPNSFLGGKCLPKPTQREGEPCDAKKRCLKGLTCVKGRCQKYCQKDTDCPKDYACLISQNTCVKKCDPSKELVGPTCGSVFYCSYSSLIKPGYCKKLPEKKIGPKKLGEFCSNKNKTEYCDGNQNLFCYNNKCIKACDYSKGQKNNPDCQRDEVCTFTPYSFSGGKCEIYPTQKEGEPCGPRKRCLKGLKCINGRCAKPCTKDSDCPSGQACLLTEGGCVKKCDPSKELVGKTCGKGFYCSKHHIVKPGLCKKLPEKEKGTKKLGESCTSAQCDGDQKLFCNYPTCAKACDYSRGENGNPDCSKNEICTFNSRSFLGGQCKIKPTQREGERCNSQKICIKGLGCFRGICRKLCDPAQNNCTSGQKCYKDFSSGKGYCVIVCNPRKAILGPPCPTRHYCNPSSTVSPGYCDGLPEFKKGTKKLGEYCSNFTPSQYCDGSQQLYCRYPKCVKACDPLKGKINNPNCKMGQICNISISSPLGGYCK